MTHRRVLKVITESSGFGLLYCLRDIVCMVVIYVMRENIKYEDTHTYIGDKAEIFDQYGLIIVHQQ